MSHADISDPYVKGIQCHVAIRPDRSAAWAGDGQYPHSIKSIESFAVRPRWVFVRVETAGGVVGWGEATLEGHSEAVEGSLKDIARRYEYSHGILCRAYPDQSRRLGCHEHRRCKVAVLLVKAYPRSIPIFIAIDSTVEGR